jgi:hypothetical protein
MATTYKVLGQSAPTAATATSLYTVPSVTEAVISTINVVNTHASTADVNHSYCSSYQDGATL